MKKSKFELFSVLAIILGIVLGITLPNAATYFEFLGVIFLSLLKMLIIPIVILSLFLAITKISSIQNLKTLGAKTIGYYLLTSSIAVITGITLANLFIFKSSLNTIEHTKTQLDVNFVAHIFPSNIFQSLADGQILHIVVFTILFSLSFLFLDEQKKAPIIETADSFYEVIMKLIDWVLKLAPLGILSLVWSTIAKFDASTFSNLKSFFIATAIAAFIHSCISLPLIGKLIGRFSVFNYFWKVKQAILVSFVTASSSATLPISTKLVEENGVSKKVSRFMLPIGATLNMDGSALYQALLALLFVSLSGIEISFLQQVLLFIFIVLSSVGTAGVPSGGIVMMTMVINLLKIPNAEYYLGLYIMVDRFWDYPITSVNVWSDLVGAKTVDAFIKD